jgi:ABC-type molybdate transport system substrate-binding protein
VLPITCFSQQTITGSQLLYKKGICEKPFAYASGSVVLWSWDTEITGDSWQKVLLASKGEIAIANSATAPYGSNRSPQMLIYSKLGFVSILFQKLFIPHFF